MDYHSEYTALAWRDAKSAALYFDKVIPADFADLRRFDRDDPIYYKILQDLLPPHLLAVPTAGHVTGLHDAMIHYVSNYLMTFPATVGITKLPNETLEERAHRNMDTLVSAFEQLVVASQVKDLSIYGASLDQASAAGGGEPCLILADLALVDTSKISWRHLLEFRRDKVSVKKLHELRRFVYAEYDGKSRDFIAEDIAARIERYQDATRLWGFPLMKGLLKIALTTEGGAAMGAAVATVVFGVPLAAAAAAGIAATLGSATLAVAVRQREVDLAKKENPIAYLMEAKGLEKDSK